MALNIDYLGSVGEARSPHEYTIAVYRAALAYYEKEIEALETLNHLEAIGKVSKVLRLDPHVLTLYIDHGEESFVNILRRSIDFNRDGGRNVSKWNGPAGFQIASSVSVPKSD